MAVYFILYIYHLREIYLSSYILPLVFEYTTFSRTFIYRLRFMVGGIESFPPSIFTLFAIAGLFLRRLCDLPSPFITLYILTRIETHIYFWFGLSSHYALLIYILSLYLWSSISLYPWKKLKLIFHYPTYFTFVYLIYCERSRWGFHLPRLVTPLWRRG